MGISSAAEARLEASIRPEITAMRARTSYPRRHRPSLTVLPGGEAGAAPGAPPAGTASAPGTAGTPGMPTTAGTAAFVSGTTVRAAASFTSARTYRSVAHVRRRPAAPQPAPVRLTRRGRFVLGMLAGLAVASAAALIWLAVTGQAQAASSAGPVPAGHSGMVKVVVRPGQTLWSIAEKADPSADPRLVIQQIVDDNALGGTSVNAGQVLWVPGS